MEEEARRLAEEIERALPGWVRRAVEATLRGAGTEPPAAVLEEADQAGRRAAAEVGSEVRQLLARDVDEQETTPLALLRSAVSYPTEVLRTAGAPPVERDDFERARFPGDDYGLTPAAFADLGPEVADAGLRWGAAKAWTHKRRHGSGAT